jgi:hypothetical protein
MKTIIYFLLTLLISSCVMDTNPKLFNIQNKYSKDILVSISNDSLYGDSDIFYGTKIRIRSNKTEDYHATPLQNTFVVFFFDKDSIDTNIRNNTLQGIFQKSILNKYLLSKDSINMNDTLTFDYFKRMNFVHYSSGK